MSDMESARERPPEHLYSPANPEKLFAINVENKSVLPCESGLTLAGMSDENSEPVASPAVRKRGAPKGNLNAWKHGRRSAPAQARRAAERTRVLARLPDPNDIFPPGIHSFAPLIAAVANLGPLSSNNSNNAAPMECADAAGDENARFPANKADNSVSSLKGEGDPPPHFSTNKTNNSVARKRGAPKGNTNAVKHGRRSAKRRAYGHELRRFLADIRLSIALAHASVSRRDLERRRGRTPS